MKTKNQKNINSSLLTILLIIIAISSPWFSHSLASHSFVKAYSVVLFSSVIFLISLYHNRHNNYYQLSWLKISLLSLFVLGTASFFYSVNIDFSLSKYFIWLAVLFTFVVSYQIQIEQNQLTKLAFSLLISGSIIAFIGILQYLFNADFLLQAAIPGSTFSNKNMAAQMMVLLLLPSMYCLFLANLGKIKLFLATFGVALMIIFTFYTSTRAALLSISVELLLLIIFIIIKRKTLNTWMHWNKSKTLNAALGLGFVLIMINLNSEGFYPIWQNLGGIIDETAGNATNAEYSRFKIWQAASSMIEQSPFFGTGLGSWVHNEIDTSIGESMSLLSENGYSVANYKNVHNDFIETVVELGFVGITLFLLMSTAVLYSLFKIIGIDEKPIALFYYLLFIALSGSFVNMLFSFPYQLAAPSAIFGIYTGLIAKRVENFTTPVFSFQLPQFAKPTIMLGFTILIGFVFWVYSHWIVVYSKLDSMAQNNAVDIEKLQTPFYYKGFQNSYSQLANDYFAIQGYKYSTKIDKQIIKKWQRNESSYYRLGYGFRQLDKNQQALDAFNLGIQNVKLGSFILHIGKIETLQKMKRQKDVPAAYKNLFQVVQKSPDSQPVIYKFLAKFAIQDYLLWSYLPKVYNKFMHYYEYDCHLENALASHYINQKNYQLAQQHRQIIMDNNGSCLNPQISKILEEQNKLKP